MPGPGRPRSNLRPKIAEYLQENPHIRLAKVAQQFGCSHGLVKAVSLMGDEKATSKPPVSSLITPSGYRITKKEARRIAQVQKKRDAREALRTRIIEYAQANLTASYTQIAKAVGTTHNLVSTTIRLAGLNAGAGKSRAGGSRFERSIDDFDSPRCETIRESFREDWTLSETGKVLGVTRERARQLKNIYLSKYEKPEGIITERFPTIDVAHKLHVSPMFIRKVAKLQGIGRRRGMRQMTFTADEVQQLDTILLNETRRACANCGTVFFRSMRGPRGYSYCQRACQAAHRYKLLRNPTEADLATPDNTRFYQPLALKLQDRPEETEYVRLKDALTISGATAMQVMYLRYRKLIRTVPSPCGRMRQGNPIMVYSLSDIHALRDFLKRKQKAR